MHIAGGLISLLLPFLTLSSESRLFSGLLCVVVTSLRPTFSTEEACRRTLTPFVKGEDEKKDTTDKFTSVRMELPGLEAVH